MSAVIAVVLTFLGLRLRALIRATRRRQARVYEAAILAAHDAPTTPVDPIDWDAVDRRDTQPMRRIEVAS